MLSLPRFVAVTSMLAACMKSAPPPPRSSEIPSPASSEVAAGAVESARPAASTHAPLEEDDVDASATLPAAPAIPPYQNPPNVPAAWIDCRQDECTMVRNECCDAWSVVNAHSAEAAREMNLRRSRSMKGARPGASPCRRSCADPGIPTCTDGRCTFRR